MKRSIKIIMLTMCPAIILATLIVGAWGCGGPKVSGKADTVPAGAAVTMADSAAAASAGPEPVIPDGVTSIEKDAFHGRAVRPGEPVLMEQVAGEWLFEERSASAEYREINAVARRTYKFERDGSLYLEEKKKGQSQQHFKEDWEFKTWGTYSFSGDTIMVFVNRFQSVRQTFEKASVVDGKQVWETIHGPVFDSPITDGSHDRQILFSDLKKDFTKIR